MFPEHEEQIRAEAIAEYPREAVWFITSKGCHHVDNIHEDPEHYFEVSERDTRAAMSEGLLAVVHSHPNGIAAPSASDMRQQIGTAVPWAIVITDGVAAQEIVWWGKGVPKAPLLGRTFRHGITDCYALIKDYYDVELGIELPEFPRDWEWWDTDENLFEDGFIEAGFVRIDASEIRPGDVWLAQVGNAGVANHGGVLIENDLMLHQIGSREAVDYSRPSAREPIYRYLRHITHWLRYEGGRP